MYDIKSTADIQRVCTFALLWLISNAGFSGDWPDVLLNPDCPVVTVWPVSAVGEYTISALLFSIIGNIFGVAFCEKVAKSEALV